MALEIFQERSSDKCRARMGIRLIPPIYPRPRFLSPLLRTRSLTDDADKAPRLTEVPALRFVRPGIVRDPFRSSLCERREGKETTYGGARDVVGNGVDVVSGSAPAFPKRRVVERNERVLLRAM